MNYTLQGYIDCGAPTLRISKEILQAMQVGRGAPIGFPFSTGNASLC